MATIKNEWGAAFGGTAQDAYWYAEAVEHRGEGEMFVFTNFPAARTHYKKAVAKAALFDVVAPRQTAASWTALSAAGAALRKAIAAEAAANGWDAAGDRPLDPPEPERTTPEPLELNWCDGSPACECPDHLPPTPAFGGRLDDAEFAACRDRILAVAAALEAALPPPGAADDVGFDFPETTGAATVPGRLRPSPYGTGVRSDPLFRAAALVREDETVTTGTYADETVVTRTTLRLPPPPARVRWTAALRRTGDLAARAFLAVLLWLALPGAALTAVAALPAAESPSAFAERVLTPPPAPEPAPVADDGLLPGLEDLPVHPGTALLAAYPRPLPTTDEGAEALARCWSRPACRSELAAR